MVEPFVCVQTNNTTCKVISIGTVNVKMFDAVVKELTQVKHVSNFKRNLISLGILYQIVFAIKGEKGTLKIIKSLMVIMESSKNNG